MKKCLFLDRDGTINKNFGYVGNYKRFKWLKNAKRGIKYAYDKKYLIIIISNQSGVARKLFSEADCEILNRKINEDLKKHKCKIHHFYYAFYHPKFKKNKYKKNFRKPCSGLILKAKREFNINIDKSFMIGDKITDKLAAQKVNLRFKYKKRNLLYEIKSII